MYSTLVLSILALLSGFGMRYWINRRKFYRRSPLGVEGFSSYEKISLYFISGTLRKMDSLYSDYFWTPFFVELFKRK
ncbi:hypothetical protein [Flavobacterium flabelliforme]|uniref:hypothetical protein n=1 Tax=Flavobacterium flabelliforme TaxID=2816119 RepID=UPI003743B53D